LSFIVGWRLIDVVGRVAIAADLVVDICGLEAQLDLQLAVDQAQRVLQEELGGLAGRDVVALQVDRLVEQRRAVGVAVLHVVARLGAVIVVVLEPQARLEGVEPGAPLALGR
jgi:hypothetical protein